MSGTKALSWAVAAFFAVCWLGMVAAIFISAETTAHWSLASVLGFGGAFLAFLVGGWIAIAAFAQEINEKIDQRDSEDAA